MRPKRVFWFVNAHPSVIWRVARILLQASIYAELQENEHGLWLIAEDRPNLSLALGATSDLIDYGLQAVAEIPAAGVAVE